MREMCNLAAFTRSPVDELELDVFRFLIFLSINSIKMGWKFIVVRNVQRQTVEHAETWP